MMTVGTLGMIAGRLAARGLFWLAALSAPCLADDAPGPDANGITSPSIATSLPFNGDPWGIRKDLAARGITYSFFYTNDVLANVDGGTKRGTIDQGKLEGALTVDLEKLAGLKGLTFFSNVFQIDNTGRIRRDYVGGINTIAAIEARPTTRLSELWLEQKVLDGKGSVRVGQLAADTEFFFSSLSTMFLQSDWATISATNMPSGGPAYPLSTPGVRFKLDPMSNTSILLAILNGDPAGPGKGDEQLRNKHGLNFRVQDAPLVIAEAQFRSNADKADKGLASTVKLGAWGHFGTFDDQRFAADGGLLGNPATTTGALRHEKNVGIYGIFEQQLYRPAGGAADSGVSVYTRVSASPSDRNLISFYVDGGIVVSSMVPNRPDDKFGVGFIYAQYSDAVRNFDRDVVRLTATPGVIRDFETNLEINYQAQIIPGWIVQPNIQHIWHPSGDESRDATVVGVRSFWQY